MEGCVRVADSLVVLCRETVAFDGRGCGSDDVLGAALVATLATVVVTFGISAVVVLRRGVFEAVWVTSGVLSACRWVARETLGVAVGWLVVAGDGAEANAGATCSLSVACRRVATLVAETAVSVVA